MNEDKAVRYNRLKRLASIASTAWTVALLASLLWSGSTVTLRGAAESAAARAGATGPLATASVVGIYVLWLAALNEIGSLPLAFYGGFLVERRYGLSNERLGGWIIDRAKAFGVGFLLSLGAVALVYSTIHRWPDGWWLISGAAFAVVIVGLVNLAPIVLIPLFYRVKPLDRESLRVRLLALANRAGARVLGAYEWGLGEKTKKANAALTGIGSTRRILVSDTMLAEYSDDEIEVVLAHEIAHHVHGDIWKSIVFESALVLAGFYAAARLLTVYAHSAGLRGTDDVAGLPILLLAAGAVSLVMMPAAHAVSRAYERNADRFALDLTRNPDAFISAMRRLGAQNLAEEHPSRVVRWLFYSHPPIPERIAVAQAFAKSLG